MAFCNQCGHQLADGSKFCNECGSPIVEEQRSDDISLDVEISIRVVLKGDPSGKTETEVYLPHLSKTVVVKVPNGVSIGQALRLHGMGHTSGNGEKGDAYIRIVKIDYDNTVEERQEAQRKVRYEGEVRVCPQCREVINAFVPVCPSCGHEIRGAKAVSSVTELARKLEAIEAQRERKDSRTYKERMHGEAITKTDEQKISLIRSFAIPNTKEDLYEFLVLAGSNIDVDLYGDLYEGKILNTDARIAVSDAWKAKFEQAYQKAKTVLKGDSLLFEVENLYHDKMAAKEQVIRRRKMPFIITCGGLALFLVIFLVVIFVSDSISIKRENARLDAIVEEVYSLIECENYIAARSKASMLIFSGSTTQAGDQAAIKWEIARGELLDVIDKAEYGNDYVSGPKEIRMGITQDDLKDEDYQEVKQRLEARGFTNIKTEPIQDLLTGWWTEEGTVDKVSIGGDLVFSEESTYLSDVEIIIYYHAVK